MALESDVALGGRQALLDLGVFGQRCRRGIVGGRKADALLFSFPLGHTRRGRRQGSCVLRRHKCCRRRRHERWRGRRRGRRHDDRRWRGLVVSSVTFGRVVKLSAAALASRWLNRVAAAAGGQVGRGRRVIWLQEYYVIDGSLERLNFAKLLGRQNTRTRRIAARRGGRAYSLRTCLFHVVVAVQMLAMQHFVSIRAGQVLLQLGEVVVNLRKANTVLLVI